MKGNRYKKSQFITIICIYAFFTMGLYRKYFFSVIPGQSLASSIIILWVLELLSVGIGIALNWKNHCNAFAAVSSILLGFCVYSSMSYKFFRAKISKLFTLAVIISVVLAIVVFLSKRKTKNKIWLSLLNTHRLMTFAALIVVVPLLGRIYFGKSLVNSKVKPVVGVESDETINKNMDTLLKLRAETWDSLFYTEKIGVLQTVANIEAHHLGLNHELNVEMCQLSEHTLGEYRSGTYKIAISLDEIENEPPMRCVQTVCHEAYHGYQHELISLYERSSEKDKELYVFQKAKKYQEEFNNYKDANDDFTEYYFQECEKDARLYASNAVYEYTNRIYD